MFSDGLTRFWQEICTGSAGAVAFARAINKSAAESKDKENLFVDESPYPDVVEQKRSIAAIEGELYTTLRSFAQYSRHRV